MSETYSTCDVTDETRERLVILFSLVVARKLVHRDISKWPDDFVDIMDELIEEYRNPYSEDELVIDRDSFAQAPRR